MGEVNEFIVDIKGQFFLHIFSPRIKYNNTRNNCQGIELYRCSPYTSEISYRKKTSALSISVIFALPILNFPLDF